MNMNWNRVTQGLHWDELLTPQFRKGHHEAVAFNEHSGHRLDSTSRLYGGCTANVFNSVAHRVVASGTDKSGLGRFAWIKLRGRKVAHNANGNEDMDAPSSHQDIVVISAYRPNPAGTGAETVWAQHRNHFMDNGRQDDPREAFMIDLLAEIELWQQEGCEIILGVDANENLKIVNQTSFRQRMRAIGLREAILTRHGRVAPATHRRNKKDEPIDGLFHSEGIKVLASGYYQFDHYIESDHRAIWMDIDLRSSLGTFKPKSSVNPRRLHSNDYRIVKRYNNLVEKGYHEYDVPGRLEQLNQDLIAQEGKLTPRQEEKFNTLHQQMYTIRRHAEKHCRKLHMGGVPWSPRSQAILSKRYMWKMLIKCKKGIRVSSRLVRRLLKSNNAPNAWKLSLEDLKLELAKTRREWTEAKPKALTWRFEHITVLSTAAKKLRTKSKKASQRKAKILKLKQKEEARRRKRALGKGFSGGLQMIQVEIPSPNGEPILRTLSSRQEVEAGCMEENSRRYDQTRFPYPTPPMSDPFYDLFNGEDQEQQMLRVLQGRWDPSSYSTSKEHQSMIQFLDSCRYEARQPPVPMEVPISDHVNFWSKMDEYKGCEPHGLHNGHFKAGAMSAVVAQCDAWTREIPLKTGLVPIQWRHLMNFAIEKTPGNFRVRKMRTIQMMNSELQANNKKVGREAMAFAEAHNLLPEGQYGSRKKHQAIDQAAAKQWIWDLHLLQRRAAVWISNDATSCFDRVVHWVAMLCLMRMGIQYPVVAMMFGTLAQAAHRVRTGFGDSTDSFSPPSEIPYQGCGQGNGAGPTIWVSISAVIMLMMKALGFGFECLTALTGTLINAEVFAFVDDADVIESAKSVWTSGEELMARAQQALDTWTGGIKASGGAVNPEKSFMYLIDFKFTSSGHWRFKHTTPHKTRPESPNPETPSNLPTRARLSLFGLSNNKEWLDQKEVNDAQRTLGVWMSPEFNSGPQLQHLLTKAKEWAGKVRSARLMKHDLFPMITTTIMKTMEYPMALCFFSKNIWERILSPVLMASLPKAGVCRSFPRVMVYALHKFQGLNIPHPFALQVFQHLDMIARHSANQTKAYRFLDANLQAHQLETGTSYGLFQQVADNTAILASDTWCKRVWMELDSLDIHLEMETPMVSPQREHDALLMDIFINAEVDQHTLLWLNNCRMFLNVSTLADITTADGARIKRTAWNGIRDDSSPKRFSWPRTIRPSEQYWEIWRSCLQESVIKPHDNTRGLRQRLGKWNDDFDRWPWLFSPSENALLRRFGSCWTTLVPVSNRSTNRTFWIPQGLIPRTQPIPLDAVRVSVDISKHRHPISRAQPFEFCSTGTALITGLGDPKDEPLPILKLLDRWQQLQDLMVGQYGWVPEHIRIQGSEAELIEALQTGHLRIISDGSFKNEIGSAAIQLRTKKSHKNLIQARCRTPGLPQDQSAYRSELIGILVGIMIASWLREQIQLPASFKPNVQIGCDGLSALLNSFSIRYLRSTAKQFDLLSAIRHAIRSSNISWSPRHILGHADRDREWEDLTWWERRNVEVDRLASSLRQELEDDPSFMPSSNPRFFSEPCAIFINGVKQSRLSRSHIQETITLPGIKEYWQKRNRISEDAFAVVDWSAMQRGVKSLPPGIQRWMTKHTVGMCSVGKFRLRWKHDSDDLCPRCGLPEDHRHVNQCSSTSANKTWKACIQDLHIWLDGQHTDPSITRYLLEFLSWNRNPGASAPPNAASEHNSKLVSAILEQAVIGPCGILEGLLSSKWALVQQEFFTNSGSRKSGGLWAARLVQQLLMIGFTMWEDRNDALHSDKSLKAIRQSREVNDAIRNQFRMGTKDLPLNIRPYLRTSLHNVLLRPLAVRQEWIRLVSRERSQFRRQARKQQRVMTKWLRSTSSST